MLFTIKVLTFCGLFLLLSIRNAVNSERCARPAECFPIRNNKSCIKVTRNTGNSDWFTSASACETTGGRLLWLHDVNITAFTNNHLLSIINSNCTGCSFLWIGLMQSIFQDNRYFWKRTQIETANQCHTAFTCANCSNGTNQIECERLGCCYRDHSCKYPGNVTIDMQHEYEYHGTPYHGRVNDSFRHCVGLQKTRVNSWTLRTVECSETRFPMNGHICEYKCGMQWPTPSPRMNISVITLADTGCADTTLTTPGPSLTTPPTGAENCMPNLKRCYPIHGRNSCLKLEQNNHSSNWFYSAGACEKNGGRLLWLFNQNVKTFMSVNTKTMIRNACPNCTFLWIGLMQSTFHDDNFFWKRTQNETLKQCQDPPSSVICAVNATRKECDMLGCCFNASGCFYADNVTVDRQHEYHEMNRVNNSSPGYRRCVGLHKPSSSAPWTPSVYDCSENITDIHGYFCEYRCGNDWPVPAPYVTTSSARTTTASKSTTSTTIQTSTSTKSRNTVLSSSSSKTNSALQPANVTTARNSSVLSNSTSPKAAITTTLNSSTVSNISNITTTLIMTPGTRTIASITTTTSIKSSTSKIFSNSPALSNIATTLKMTSYSPTAPGINTTAFIKSSTSNVSSRPPVLSNISTTLKMTSSTRAIAGINTTTSTKLSTSNTSSRSPALSYVTTTLQKTSKFSNKTGIASTPAKSSASNTSSMSPSRKTTTSLSQPTTTGSKATRSLSNLTAPTSTSLLSVSTESSSRITTVTFTRTSSTPTIKHSTITETNKTSTLNVSSSVPILSTTTSASPSVTTNTRTHATSNAKAVLTNATIIIRRSTSANIRSTTNLNSSMNAYTPAFNKTSTVVPSATPMPSKANTTQLIRSVTTALINDSSNGNTTLRWSKNSLPQATISVSPPTSQITYQTSQGMLHKNGSASKKNFGETNNENDGGGKLSTGAIVGISVAAILIVILSSVTAIICIRHFSTTRIGTESPSPGISMSQTHDINIAFNTVRKPIQGLKVKGRDSNMLTIST